MHSMHQLQTHRATSRHIQQQQNTLATAGQDQHLNGDHEQQQQQADMTVLESLEPVLPTSSEPILSTLDPVSSQQVSELQQSPPIIHHMVQAAPQPHLHILHAPCRQQEQEQLEQQQQQSSSSTGPCNTLPARQHQHQHQHQQQQQQHQQLQQRPQHQIDGIVAGGGEPIVQWLLENYEIAEGESLPRSTVYNHYLAHCRRLRIASVNAASFGKLIRSVFVGLKTRRLGTRGHSKYHYFGVRAKQHVRFDWIHRENEHANTSNDDGQFVRRAGCSSMMMRDLNNDNSNQNTDNGSESDSTGDCSGRLSSLGGGGGSSINNNHSTGNNNNGTIGASKRIKRVHESSNDIDFSDHHGLGYTVGNGLGQPMDQHEHHFEEVDHNQQYASSGGTNYLNGYGNCNDIKQDSSGSWPMGQYDLSSFKSHLGSNNDTLVDEHWPQCELGSLERELAGRLSSGRAQTDLTEDLSSLVRIFESQYKTYYKRMVDLLSNLNFNEIEHLWSEFWHPPPAPVAHETVQWSGESDASNGINQQQQHSSVQQSDTSTSTDADNITQQHQQHLSYDQLHHQQQQFHHQRQQMLQATNLTYNQLYQLTSHPIMIDRINQIDYKLYSAIESFLVPDILRPMPRPLMHHIRLFARDIGSWTESAIKLYNPKFVSEKMKSVRALEYALRRYTSINHLSTASRAIWNKRSVLVQMSIDLNRIDLRDIEHQVSLMSQAKLDQLVNDSRQDDRLLTTGLHQRTIGPVVNHNGGNGGDGSGVRNQDHSEMQSDSLNSSSNNTSHHQNQTNDNIENRFMNHDNSNRNNASNDNSLHADSVDHLHQDGLGMMQPAQLIQNFLHLLDDPYPANMWPGWCRNLVESRVCGQSFDEARNFILKWNFYISLILRELTLRSAPSLGSFQLIRLLFDEYMYYLVVTRLAQAHHKTSTQLLRSSVSFDNF